MTTTILLDVDGTLVDTNYHHALAWYRAFRDNGCILPLWRLHRHMGMGGDQLVAAVAGDDTEQRCGDPIREAEGGHYGELIDEVSLLPGARDLLERLSEANWTTVLASSAKAPELDHYLDLLDARHLVSAWTGAADVKATKPQPDLIHVALEKVGASSGLLVGDSVFDCEAAARAGIDSVALLTGGFSREELSGAGAVEVVASIAELSDWLFRT
ncbi:MAG: HAD family hydrolase [Actinomycetota bacterium]